MWPDVQLVQWHPLCPTSFDTQTSGHARPWGFVKGEPSTTLAAELELHYITVLELRHDLRDNARWYQPKTALSDSHSETDEM